MGTTRRPSHSQRVLEGWTFSVVCVGPKPVHWRPYPTYIKIPRVTTTATMTVVHCTPLGGRQRVSSSELMRSPPLRQRVPKLRMSQGKVRVHFFLLCPASPSLVAWCQVLLRNLERDNEFLMNSR